MPSHRPALRTWLSLLVGIAGGCARHEPEATAPAKPSGSRTVAKQDAATSSAKPSVEAPGPARADIGPPQFHFVGLAQMGQASLVAIQDPATRKGAWHRIGDSVDHYELAGLQDGRLVVRASGTEYSIPLEGVEILQAAAPSPQPPGPAVVADNPAPPMIKIWADGVGTETTPEKVPPELLRTYTNAKEAMLAAKVPPEYEGMLAQALESNTAYVASGPDGFKRSDFPPEIAAKLTDEALAQINAAGKRASENGAVKK